MDKVSHRPSNTSALIAAMQPSETGDERSTGQSVEGGVPLTHHIMDDNIPDDESLVPPSTLTQYSQAENASSLTVAAPGSKAQAGLVDKGWPSLRQSIVKGLYQEDHVIEGLSQLKLGSSHQANSVDHGMYKVMFQDKRIPQIGQWPEPSMPDYRRNMVPSKSGEEHIIRTDWDAFQFERSPLNSNYDCPFSGCGYVSCGACPS